MLEQTARIVVMGEPSLPEAGFVFGTSEPTTAVKLASLVARFKDTVCRYPDEFKGAKRSEAVAIFKKALANLDPVHEYMFLDEETLLARIC